MTRAVFVSALYQMKQETEGAESMPAGETDLSPKPGGQSEEDGAEQSGPPVPAKDLFGDVTGDEWFVPALNGRRNRRSSMELTVISVRIRRSIARRWLS